MESIRLSIAGMSCGHCVAAIESALGAVEGATASQISVGFADITYDPQVTSITALQSAVRDAGFDVVGSVAL